MDKLRILQVNTSDGPGGAEMVSRRLWGAYRRLGHRSWLAVGRSRGPEDGILLIPDDARRSRWSRLLSRAGRAWERAMGWEDFHHPGTWKLPGLTPEPPDVIHGHNLHGSYFDLRALPWMCSRFPVFLTLHDAWLLSGHCAHSLDCERWLAGCGLCPDLSLYPAVRRDATAFNWRRKRDLYARCRLQVAAPSRWLMEKVERSMLSSAAAETRVIPYGVDLSIFHPGDRRAARSRLSLPLDARVVLTSAYGIRANVWKDFPTMAAAMGLASERLGQGSLVFVALGEQAPPERVGRAEVRFIPFVEDPGLVADYHRSADVYLHAARADTFPNVVLEALACGVPVAATAVGGIPEQVKSPDLFGPEEATGLLTRAGDAEGLSRALLALLEDQGLRERLGGNAARDARLRFDLDREAAAYLEWYRAVLEGRRRHGPMPPPGVSGMVSDT